MTRRKTFALLAVALGIGAACSSPTLVCACSFPGPFGVAYGTVTAGGPPVAAARLHAVVMAPGCSESTAVVLRPDPQPATAADGSYQLYIPRTHEGNTHCVRVVAERAPGDSAFTQVADFDVNGIGNRTLVDIAFP